MTEREHAARSALLVAAFAFALYLPALGNDFVNWDDDIFVLENEAVRSPNGLRRIWSTLELPAEFPNYPLLFTSLWVDNRLWGTNPAGYHATNNLLHAANAALVLLLARAFGCGTFAALLAACLFASHPLHVESVAWVSERKNLLSTFFSLCSLLAFARHRRTNDAGAYALALAAFAAALLSKTAVATLPLSLLLLERFQARRWEAASLARIAPVLALSALAGAATVLIEPRTTAEPLFTRALAASGALLFYLQKTFAPWPLLPIYPRWDISPGSLWLLAPPAVLALAVAWTRMADWRTRWGIAHFACLLLPVLGLVPFGFLEYSYVADHHAYLPSVGFFLAFAVGMARWRSHRPGRLPALLATLIVVACCGLTLRQIPVWRDSASLWRHVIAGNADAYAAWSNLGLALADAGNLSEARAALERAVALKADYAVAFNNLGMVTHRQRDFAASEQFTRKAVDLAPRAASFRKNLALTLQAQGKATEAAEALRAAIAVDPRNAHFHLLLGDFLARAGDLSGALDACREAARLEPNLFEAHDQTGRILLALSRNEEAVRALDTALRLRPRSPEARYNLALALLRTGRTDAAASQLQEALGLRPGFRPAREELERLRSSGHASPDSAATDR